MPVVIKKRPKVFDLVEIRPVPPNIDPKIIDKETGMPAFLLRKNWTTLSETDAH